MTRKWRLARSNWITIGDYHRVNEDKWGRMMLSVFSCSEIIKVKMKNARLTCVFSLV